MKTDRLGRTRLRPWPILAFIAAAWMLTFVILTKIVGPLNPDEVMFSHMLWLTLEGKRQYVDFYSYHLPTYFYLYGLVLPHGEGVSLEFIRVVRLSNLVVVAAYAGLLIAVERKLALYLLPLLLWMVGVSRMAEVRPDTLGLLAFNGAWAVLLLGQSRQWLVIAALLAIAGAACSARGIVMGVGIGAALTWLALVKCDRRFVVIPGAALLIVVAIGGAAFAAEPRYVELMLRSSFLEPGTVLPWLRVNQRVVALDRSPQILLAVTALLLGAMAVSRNVDRGRAGLIAIAALAQLVLIFVDPSPFPYVYGWAMIPCLAGLSLAGLIFGVDARMWLGALGGACAALVAVETVAYPLITGRVPPTGSNYRVLPDGPIDLTAVRQMPVERLVALELSGEGQQSLSNQLLVREELCRRVDGRVLAAWQSHPICLHDATYHWFSVKWPNIGSDRPPSDLEPWFERLFAHDSPALFIWQIPGASVTLSPWVLSLLTGYKIAPGYAVRTNLTAVRKDSSGKAANLPHNGHN